MDSVQLSAMYDSCPVCGAASPKYLWEVKGYTIARCATCRLVFVQNIVSREELAAHYESGTEVAYDASNIECLNYYYHKLGKLIRQRFSKPGRILDVGCSRGWFLDEMKEWECHGNEIAPTDAAIARQRYGGRIVDGYFEDYPLREDYFDVITLQDVFDHFREPLAALEKCYRMLRPGGLIAIKVHNISCLYAKITGPDFYAIFPPFHLFYYDRQTLAKVLSLSGFQVVDSRFIGHLMKIKTVFWRLSRGDARSIPYRVYRLIDGTMLGELKFHKNLHDIITVLATKPV